MKIVMFGPDKRVGILRDGAVVDASYACAKYLREKEGERHPRTAAEATVPSDLARFIDGGARCLDNAAKALDYLFGQAQDKLGPRGETLVYEAGKVRLHAPRPNNARIACAGGNFADHAAAMSEKVHGEPFKGDATAEIRRTGIWGFWKVNRDLAPPEGEVPYPKRTKLFDYEGELAIVLGKRGKDLRSPSLKDYVWGVTLLGDWSIRGSQEPGPLRFAMQKNFDNSCSLGPCIAVGEADAQNCDVETLVNNDRRQRFNTRDMVFSFAEYMEYLSRDFTLFPGDIISGGTAAGTAMDSSPLLPGGGSAPERFLKPGDTVEIRSPAVGSLRTRIVAGK